MGCGEGKEEMKVAFVGLLAVLTFGADAPKSKARAKQAECRSSNDIFSWSTNVNGVHYKCSEDGRWVIDEEAMAWKAEQQAARDKLYWALRTRVLTDKEMEQVENLGISLIIREMQPFNPKEMHDMLNAALLQQFKLRDIARKNCEE